jgi:uncharacterized protein (DUF433 family)
MIELSHINPLLETPAYSLADVASYARVPYQTIRYWALGRGKIRPLIILPTDKKPTLSFLNLLECYVLNGFRTVFKLQIPSVRRALDTLERIKPSRHPLLETEFNTDGIDLFLSGTGETINLSQGGQTEMIDVIQAYLHRIIWGESGIPKLYPLVVKNRPDEPKIISIVPTIAFGRSVIDGTGITTAVIAARFNARETVQALAEEYERRTEEIEEAVRWENLRTATAA